MQKRRKRLEKITKILAATDFADYWAQTVKYAGDLADKLKAELIVVNLINQRDVKTIGEIASITTRVSEEEYLEKKEKERLALIEK